MVDLKYQVIGPCLCYKDIVHPTSEPNKYFPRFIYSLKSRGYDAQLSTVFLDYLW